MLSQTPPATKVLAPERDTILFDGDCRFCTSSVKILRWLDWTRRLDFVSLHDPLVKVRFSDLTFEQLMDQMWVVTTSGDRFGGADAIRYLTKRLPTLMPLFPFLHFPGTMPLWRSLYRWIARNRYRLAGKSCDAGTCRYHHPSS